MRGIRVLGWGVLFACLFAWNSAQAVAAPPRIPGKLLHLDGKTPWVARGLKILDVKDHVVASVLTKTDGSFSLPGLQPGVYGLQFGEVKFELQVAPGWKEIVILVSKRVGPKTPPIVIADRRLVDFETGFMGDVTLVEVVVVGAVVTIGIGGVVVGTVATRHHNSRGRERKKKRWIVISNSGL